jgi:hypothetical protein
MSAVLTLAFFGYLPWQSIRQRRVVNAVPYVVEAQTGLLSVVDLSLTIPRQAFSRRE